MKTFFLTLLFLAGCTSSPPSQKPIIFVSIAPYRDLVERVTGGTIDVEQIVPQQANPHAFEPTVKQIGHLAQGAIWFRLGEPFESKLIPVLTEKNRKLLLFDLREGIELIGGSCCHEESGDRHIWMSPRLVKEQVRKITQVLSTRFPENKEIFENNQNQLVEELTKLDLEIEGLLNLKEKKTLLVSHPAFGYFCRDYGIKQLSLEEEGKDVRPRQLEKILQEAALSSLSCAVALPQHNNKGTELIAELLSIPVKWIDPYSGDYFEMMRKLSHLVADD